MKEALEVYIQAAVQREEALDHALFFGPPGLSAEKKAAYVAAFEKMYDTPEWEEVRGRNGWVNIYNPGDDFVVFLEGQEKEIGDLMKELGFL